MKPARFDYERPADLRSVIRLIERDDIVVKIVAGSQSLGPMLNLRLVQPTILVDITAIPELTRVEEDADGITVGACVTSADIEDERVRLEELSILRAVAAGVAYRAVRNRGTIGGSICHADPAGDWLPSLCALGAECIITDGSHVRRLPVERFVTGAFEVALEPGELLQSIHIPRPSRAAQCGYYKVCRKAGEFALATGAVVFDADQDRFRAVIGATQGRPIVVDARAIFGGIPQRRGAVRLDEAAAAELLRRAGPVTSASVRLHLTALARAAAQAIAQ